MLLVQERRQDIDLVGYLEDPTPPGIVKAERALEDGPVYILFPGKRDTPYYTGVQSAQMNYQEAGLRLRVADQEAVLYRVLEDPARQTAPEPELDPYNTERAQDPAHSEPM